MSGNVYIVSTMTSNMAYTFYDRTDRSQPREKGSIIIQGGAGIPSNRSGFGEMSQDINQQPLWVADGFATPVSAENYAKLKEHPVFNKHLQKGLVRVLHKDVTGNHKEIRKVARDMQRDGFQQLTSETLKQKVKVSTAALSSESEFNRL